MIITGKHSRITAAMYNLIDYYYGICPGSVIPLFLLYLAKESSNSKTKFRIDEKVRKPLDWKEDPEKKYSSPVLSQFTREDAEMLAKIDPAGVRILERWKCNGMDHMSIVVLYDNPRLKEIREVFQKYDESLGDSMEKRRALFLFVQGLEQLPKDVLKENYLLYANQIIEKSGIFDSHEDFHLNIMESWLVGKSAKTVFVPFARTPFVAALMPNANATLESSGDKAELAAMIAELIVKGNGVKKALGVSAAKPYEDKGENKYDAIVMNYAHHSGRYDETSWHKYMKIAKKNLSDKGKYVGLVESKYLFRMVCTQALFSEILADKSLESVILLPQKFDAALIVVNKEKDDPDTVKLVNLYDENMLNCWRGFSFEVNYFEGLVSNKTVEVAIDKLKDDPSVLSSYFEKPLPDLEGFRLEKLSKYLMQINKVSSFGVSNHLEGTNQKRVRALFDTPYSPYDYKVSSIKDSFFSVYQPSYYLDGTTLLINKSGDLNAKLYYGEDDEAYFYDGLAFRVAENRMYAPYIINELRKPYVTAQLNHWSKSLEKRHSEDEILDLKIYVPIADDPYVEEQDICKKELDQGILPIGFVITNGPNEQYKIKKCLGQGGFGISYLAEYNSFSSAVNKDVVLKEFYVTGLGEGSHRDDSRRVSIDLGDIDSIRKENDVYSYLVKFIDEAETMQYFSRFPGSGLRKAYDIFKCERTNTYYYVMDYYPNGTLADLLNREEMTDEDIFIKKIMKPLATAVNLMHQHRWLHLDIKPSNILIDDKGYAVLGDFGISQHYDENGKKITKGGGVGTRGHASPKQWDMDFIETFHPELDIYSMASLFYNVFTGFSSTDFDPQVLNEEWIDLSEKNKKAISIALDPELVTTPKSVPEFINMLKGCTQYLFPEIKPVDENEVLDIIDDSIIYDEALYNLNKQLEITDSKQ